MREKEAAFSNTKIAVIFFVFIIFIIGISLTFKFIAVLKSGQLNDSRSFSIGMSDGRNAQLVILSRDSKSITVFKLTGIKAEEAGRTLRAPIDSFVTSDSLDLNQKINSLFLALITNYKKLKTNLTIVDLLRINLFVRSIPQNSINIMVVKNMNKLTLDKAVNRLIADSFIEKDNQTIQIINGTSISGFGNRLAGLITNMGGNVIIVATENSPVKKSSISYIDKKSYTVERLHKVLGYDVIKRTGSGMADITITIGEDSAGSSSF
jgi:hypothetical protein